MSRVLKSITLSISLRIKCVITINVVLLTLGLSSCKLKVRSLVIKNLLLIKVVSIGLCEIWKSMDQISN